MTKEAQPDYPVHELITRRWSPYAFSERPVSRDDLRSLFEAARWAASSYNEQPWSYIVAIRDDQSSFERMLSCLVEANQLWARHAPVLAISVAAMRFSRNDAPNRVAVHDLGLAAANLTLEATARGIHVHQMAGILPDRARELFDIPEKHEAVTGIAIGYLGSADDQPDELTQRDTAPRSRKPLSNFLFHDGWAKPAPWVR